MPMRSLKLLGALLAAAVFTACGGGAADNSERDITLPPAESVAALNDELQQSEAQMPVHDTEAESHASPSRSVTPPPRLDEGTAFVVHATDTITSRTDSAGMSVTATVEQDIRDAGGRVVIPAGAVLEGTITEIKPAPNPEASGTLSLAFTAVRIDGVRFDIDARVDSLGTVRQGRGVTGGDAAKVGVGAAAGAIAGRVLGGDATGTVVGGVIGAATGAGVAAVTKDSDIVLPAGAQIVLVLNARFGRER